MRSFSWIHRSRRASANRLNGNFEHSTFQDLWRRINGKHAYTVALDSDELVEKAVQRIDWDLVVSEVAYSMTVGTRRGEATREALAGGGLFAVRRSVTEAVDAGAVSGVAYDLLGEVAG